jgi:hypothetical protein
VALVRKTRRVGWQILMAVTYFGNNSNGDGNTTLAANYIYATRFTNDTTGNITELGINLQAALTGHIRIGVYNITAEANHPGTLVVDAGALTNPGTGWTSITGLSTAVTAATDYYLAFVADAGPTFYTLSTGFNSYISRAYGVLPDPAGDIGGAQGNGLCMRCGVEAAGGATNVVQMLI